MTFIKKPLLNIVFGLFVTALVAVGVFWNSTSEAKSPVPSLNLSQSGLALRGYDPVAYFNAGKPVKGKSSISVSNAGATYRFSSQANKDLFLQNPTKYLPAYGGYCAYGTAVGAKVDGDPKVWSVVNGRLYLNINRSVDRTWKKAKGTYIRQANKAWPGLKNQ